MRKKSKRRVKWDSWDRQTDAAVESRDLGCVVCWEPGGIHHLFGRGQSKWQTRVENKAMVCNSHHPPRHEMPPSRGEWAYTHVLNRPLMAHLRREYGYSYGVWNERIDDERDKQA